MYKGFHLELQLEQNHYYWECHAIGDKNYLKIKKPIEKTLKSFLYPDNGIDGSKLQEEWFPQFNTDVFISHSHADKDLAIFLAGYLYKEHGIMSFIDSSLWGYANNLLKDINNDYSWLDQSKNIYQYSEVVYAASHIHMMLSNALTMAIDKSECFILLNTPNSIKSYGTRDKTESPWIYTEIALSKFIRKNIPDRVLVTLNEAVENKTFSAGLSAPQLRIDYNLDVTHLKKLNHEKLFEKWGTKNYKHKFEALDNLYKIK